MNDKLKAELVEIQAALWIICAILSTNIISQTLFGIIAFLAIIHSSILHYKTRDKG